MSQSNEHRTRTEYSELVTPLRDAERVIDDMLRIICQRDVLLIDPRELEFLARRSRELVTAARRDVERGGA